MYKNSLMGGRCVLGVLALAAVLLTSVNSQAAIFNYTDQFGANVNYVDISENTHSDPLPLFGAPAVTGDVLDFTPPNFFATSQLATPVFDLTDGLLKFTAVSTQGAIQNMKFAEGGALSVVGANATDVTFIDVSAVGTLDVLQIDGVSVPAAFAPIKIPINFTFSFGSNAAQDNGTWRRVSEGFANGMQWTGGQFIDINQELINRGVPFVNGATLVTVVLDNSLYAQSEAVGGAFIDKKDFFTVTTNIPEPTSCLMALVGLVGAVMISRRGR